jgi:hypothetical protein
LISVLRFQDNLTRASDTFGPPSRNGSFRFIANSVR